MLFFHHFHVFKVLSEAKNQYIYEIEKVSLRPEEQVKIWEISMHWNQVLMVESWKTVLQ